MNYVVRVCLVAAFGLSSKKDCREENQKTFEKSVVTKSDAP